MNPEIQNLIKIAIADGQVSDKEREIILRKAKKLGLDVDEIEMYLEGFISSNKLNTSSNSTKYEDFNLESKTSKKYVGTKREYTPKTVKHIEPASLDKEKDLKLIIEELNTSKAALFEELENLYRNIKTYQDYLESQKILVLNQLGILKSKYINTSKNYLDNLINELNTIVSEKYGKTTLIYNNSEELFELSSKEIAKEIIKNGVWEISELNNKRKKHTRLIIRFIIPSLVIYFIVVSLIKGDTNKNYVGIIFGIFGGILYRIYSHYLNLIKKNKMNFTDEDLNPIIKDIINKFENELEELVTLKTDINNLEKLKSKLEMKNIIKLNRK